MIRALAGLLLVPALALAEIPLAEPAVVPADTRDYTRFEPLVVAGDGFLVVWEEALWSAYPGGVKARAYDADGRPRRAFATSVTHVAHDPRVVWTGTEYLLVGATSMGRFGATFPLPVVYSMLIAADGTVIEGSQIVLAESRSRARVISLAWDGSVAYAYFEVDGARRLVSLNGRGRVVSLDATIGATRPAAVLAAPGAPPYFLRAEDGDVAAVTPRQIAVVDNTGVDRSSRCTTPVTAASRRS